MSEDHLLELVQRNLELTEKLTKDMKKIRHHFWLSSVWSVIKISIFLAPVIGGYFFLKPYLGTVQSLFEQVMGIQKTVQGLQENIGELKSTVKGVQGAVQGTAGGALPQGVQLPSLDVLQGLFGTKK